MLSRFPETGINRCVGAGPNGAELWSRDVKILGDVPGALAIGQAAARRGWLRDPLGRAALRQIPMRGKRMGRKPRPAVYQEALLPSNAQENITTKKGSGTRDKDPDFDVVNDTRQARRALTAN